MSKILDRILEVKRAEVAAAKEEISLAELQGRIKDLPKCRNFYRALTRKKTRGINVVTEIKRASPSAGTIREDFDPVELAEVYARCGADAVSVLTDEQFFQGHLDYIRQVKEAVSLPVSEMEGIWRGAIRALMEQ